MSKIAALVLLTAHGADAAQPFVPACMAEQCSAEALALGGDAYVKSLTNCTVQNFGPCATDAWNCLGDENCRAVLECAPKVLKKCQGNIWKMITDPDERKKLMCIADCLDGGKIGIKTGICVAEKCGAAAAKCLVDKTCIETVLCIPEATLSCSKAAFGCVFGSSSTCRQNLQCLGHGVEACAGPAVNIMTDSKIADFVSCSAGKCPHPLDGDASVPALAKVQLEEPGSTASQLLCMAEKCSSKALKIATDADTKDLVTCALKNDIPTMCKNVWDCLGDQTCAQEMSCIAKPLETCGSDIWEVLTDSVERQRIEETAACLRTCEKSHAGDFTEAAFCVLDTCSQKVLDCYNDAKCKQAVKCLPEAVGQCAVPVLDAYAHQELFRNSVKCLGRGAESCGRAAVEMLRNEDIADAIRCSAQCTRTPPLQTQAMNVVV